MLQKAYLAAEHSEDIHI